MGGLIVLESLSLTTKHLTGKINNINYVITMVPVRGGTYWAASEQLMCWKKEK